MFKVVKLVFNCYCSDSHTLYKQFECFNLYELIEYSVTFSIIYEQFQARFTLFDRNGKEIIFDVLRPFDT